MTNPRKPFTLAANPEPEKDQKDQAQDAPQPVPRPTFIVRPVPTFAPPGMAGVAYQPSPTTDPDRDILPSDRQAGLVLDAAEKASVERIDGRVINMPGYHFQATMTERSSVQNLDDGHIQRLDLWKDTDLIATYDKGWQRQPPTLEAKDAVHRIRTGLDPQYEKTFTPLVPEPDKDQGHEH